MGPNREHARREPFSDRGSLTLTLAPTLALALALTLALALALAYGGAGRNAMRGSGDVANDNRSGSNHPRLA